MLNAGFAAIWIIGLKMNKRGHEEVNKILEDGIGRQLAEFYKDWGYRA
jgi:hypothetical protein|tara:strand:- start:271 stop:414 length:144 start_codon:yes stop_codon:yes gene_type:complete